MQLCLKDIIIIAYGSQVWYRVDARNVLFAQKYPNLVDKIISLDNRRVEFPKTSQPKIYSLRSSDQIADEGILPSIEEQEKFKIIIIQLKNTTHKDMTDNATKTQKNEMNKYITEFLKE